MNRERIKLIVQNLESLIRCLKQELEESSESPVSDGESMSYYPVDDYDEIYDENEDY